MKMLLQYFTHYLTILKPNSGGLSLSHKHIGSNIHSRPETYFCFTWNLKFSMKGEKHTH